MAKWRHCTTRQVTKRVTRWMSVYVIGKAAEIVESDKEMTR